MFAGVGVQDPRFVGAPPVGCWLLAQPGRWVLGCRFQPWDWLLWCDIRLNMFQIKLERRCRWMENVVLHNRVRTTEASCF